VSRPLLLTAVTCAKALVDVLLLVVPLVGVYPCTVYLCGEGFCCSLLKGFAILVEGFCSPCGEVFAVSLLKVFAVPVVKGFAILVVEVLLVKLLLSPL
jgi:hypothetical protein